MASKVAVSDAVSTEEVDGNSDMEWNGSLPTWRQCETHLPLMKEARRFYRYLMPACLFINLVGVLVPVTFIHFLLQRVLKGIDNFIFALILCIMGVTFFTSPILYIYHYFRLRHSTELPKPLPLKGRVAPKPLLHAVVVVAYKEPMEVLHRTFASIANQTGLGRKPIAVFATEARDESRHAAARELQEAYGDKLDRILVTEHVLAADETAGKSSNENCALRRLRQVLDAEGVDPFEVMVTIVDADSILSATYLAHVEHHFYKMPDGRRMIFNGPLNTYRNFAEGNLLVQFWEVRRCHTDTFYSPFEVMHPQSNYSLTLGFIAEIDYWTPDNMPEDVHTSTKAALVRFGVNTTVSIESVICNDLVPGIKDRYVQAKRHQWGITEVTYVLGVFSKSRMQAPLKVWLNFWGQEAGRTGSFFESLTFSGVFVRLYLFHFLFCHPDVLTPQVKFLLMTFAVQPIFKWTMFWVVEFLYWRSPMMTQFPIENISPLRWAMMVILSPLLDIITELMFYIVPTVHCLLHATFIGELAYICAPKGQQAAAATTSTAGSKSWLLGASGRKTSAVRDGL